MVEIIAPQNHENCYKICDATVQLVLAILISRVRDSWQYFLYMCSYDVSHRTTTGGGAVGSAVEGQRFETCAGRQVFYFLESNAVESVLK